ncbi:M20 metallopeptidase family protein [Glycomyces algeriensis]|uniref:Amidohydrolase n=1 Tax=Glycomyces algeriensis TaxID=256037 RepID=A0A9W6G9A1_9ACTN|nr:amidohydrolase [Glycomyces algeriensis]MDA1364921.1 amidohydrolase [Glycomyces algeriensis]MDR7350019.1 amidohydrolase [Glycomyces algeriensis]GLI42730.1 amidohydrolase [Glycomyces algeriensis]
MSRFTIDTPALTRRAVIGAAAVAAATAVPGAAQAGTALHQDAIDDAAARFEADLIALRRDLHAHPEGPGEEARTAALVAEHLTAAGLAVTTGVGGHGVVGVLKGRRSGRTVAFRADMDAVPGNGSTGPAHGCGHDLHTAVGVGTALTLASLRSRLHGTVVFVFQPAEESLAGARAMLDAGVLETYGFTEIHALHCGPLPVGTFGVNPGLGLPGQDHGSVVVTGADAPARAAALAAEIAGLSTVAVPADSADLEDLVEHLQTEDGPLAEFVTMRANVAGGATADRAEVRLSYRCWPEERYTQVRADIAELAEPQGAVDFPKDPFPALVCPEADAHELKRHLRRNLGRDAATVMHAVVPFNGEDFALFIAHVPGTFTWLGVRAPGTDIATAAPHFPPFEPDEAAIGHGVRAMAGWLASRTRC